MAQLRPHLAAFVKAHMERGFSLVEAMRADGALQAELQDQIDARRADKDRSTEQWLVNVKPDEDGVRRFHSQAEMLAAMSDPQYKESEAYRSAVKELIANTDAEALGVSGRFTSSDGRSVAVGRNGLSEAATEESMLENMRIEAAREQWHKFDRSTATGRYQLAKWMSENKDLVAQMEGEMVSPEQRARWEMLDAQEANGGALRTQFVPLDKSDNSDGTVHAPHAKDIDFARGTYMDGSPLPIQGGDK